MGERTGGWVMGERTSPACCFGAPTVSGSIQSGFLLLGERWVALGGTVAPRAASGPSADGGLHGAARRRGRCMWLLAPCEAPNPRAEERGPRTSAVQHWPRCSFEAVGSPTKFAPSQLCATGPKLSSMEARVIDKPLCVGSPEGSRVSRRSYENIHTRETHLCLLMAFSNLTLPTKYLQSIITWYPGDWIWRLDAWAMLPTGYSAFQKSQFPGLPGLRSHNRSFHSPMSIRLVFCNLLHIADAR